MTPSRAPRDPPQRGFPPRRCASRIRSRQDATTSGCSSGQILPPPRAAYTRRSGPASRKSSDARTRYFHPHLHAICTDGLLAPGGEFVPLPYLDTSILTEKFRGLVIDRLHEAERLSDGFKESLLSWVRSGFSVFAGSAISPHDQGALERMARYVTRPPLAIAPSPCKAPLEDADDAFTKSTKRNWARLLRKILEVDPMLCLRCGVEMKIIAVITDPPVIGRILAHVGSGRGHDPFERARAPHAAKTG
ncbi:MAG: hypothetical protein EXS14_09810 [Planctomycetes bacterium]|nr:hypothetical protein [Planctomycetota bacterium]